MTTAPALMGRPRVHPVGTTYADRVKAREEAAAITALASEAAGLLGSLAAVLDDFARGPSDPSAVVTARGDALSALGDLVEKMHKTRGRVPGIAEVRWTIRRLTWPQAGACRRDAEELRGMVERIGRK